jgi:hypothetical protein
MLRLKLVEATTHVLMFYRSNEEKKTQHRFDSAFNTETTILFNFQDINFYFPC